MQRRVENAGQFMGLYKRLGAGDETMTSFFQRAGEWVRLKRPDKGWDAVSMEAALRVAVKVTSNLGVPEEIPEGYWELPKGREIKRRIGEELRTLRVRGRS
jgi:hypothetical protein